MTRWPERTPYLIAEIGVNHDGSATRARAMIEDAAAAGFDAVKLQYWIEDELLAPSAPNAPYQGHGDQRELLAKLTLSREEIRALAATAADCGIDFLCTADGEAALRDVLDLAPTAIKIGSGDADNPWLVDAALAAHYPIVVSVGMMTDAEVDTTAARLESAEDVVVLHCVSAYPTPVAETNLWRIADLAARTGRPIGFSDHTIGCAAAVAALALGAVLVEKHVTWVAPAQLSTAAGPDHESSLPLEEAAEWVATLRSVGASIATRTASQAELANREVVRKALYARRDLPEGHAIARDDLVPLRPLLDGIPAGARSSVIGRVLAHPIPALAPLHDADLEP